MLGFVVPFAVTDPITWALLALFILVMGAIVLTELVLGLRYIPNNRVGIIENSSG